MRLELRRERPEDCRRVEELTREAFWNVYAPGCVEHYLAHVLRGAADFVPELDLVAVAGGELVGNIMYTRAGVVRGEERAEVLCFGPLSVRPDRQGRGVGGALVRGSLDMAREMGVRGVLILGDPDYYGRFGFRAAAEWGIRSGEGRLAAALQGIELRRGGLCGLEGGRFAESAIFGFDPAACEAFDRTFPEREKGWSPSQDRFLELAAMVRD